MTTHRLHPFTLLQVQHIHHHVFPIKLEMTAVFKAPTGQLPIGPLIVDLSGNFHVLVTARQQLIKQHLVDVATDSFASQVGLK